MIIDNGGLTGAQTTVSAPNTFHAVTVGHSAQADFSGLASLTAQSLSVSSGLVFVPTKASMGEVAVLSGGTLSHPAGQAGFHLTVAGDLTVAVGGAVNVNAQGQAAVTGTGRGVTTNYVGGGAGYGGTGGGGGVMGVAAAGMSYGSIDEPVDLGSGGGSTLLDPAAGGKGGGAIHLTVGGTLDLNGTLTANGMAGGMAGYSGAGGGSGGSIYVTAGVLTGTGTIFAKGGAGGGTTGGGGVGGGGAGGRIALHVGTNSFIGAASATGGSGNQYGGAGTIFTKATADGQGDLLIDNEGNAGATTQVDSFENGGRVHVVNKAVALFTGTAGNQGSVTVSTGATLRITGTFTNQGSVSVGTNGVLDVDGILNFGDLGTLSSDTSAVLTISGSLLGDTRNADR